MLEKKSTLYQNMHRLYEKLKQFERNSQHWNRHRLKLALRKITQNFLRQEKRKETSLCLNTLLQRQYHIHSFHIFHFPFNLMFNFINESFQLFSHSCCRMWCTKKADRLQCFPRSTFCWERYYSLHHSAFPACAYFCHFCLALSSGIHFFLASSLFRSLQRI